MGIAWLNEEGGFENSIIYDQVAKAAAGVDVTKVMKIMKDLEEKKSEVKDPTAYLSAALRKLGGGTKRAAASVGCMDGNFDQKLRKRIGWLNKNGFDNAILYTKVAEVAAGADPSRVMDILKQVEEKRDEVTDPNAWVCAAVRKAGGGGAAVWVPDEVPMGADDDQKLRKRIGWLNKDGGFENALVYTKISEAAAGLPVSGAMAVLKQVEEKKGEVTDPNAWVCSALRKAGGGSAIYSVDVAKAVAAALQTDVGADQKVRKRIGWLNKDGGFENALNYSKISEAAVGVDVGVVLKLLKDVEEKKDIVKDPTAYVSAALRKAGGGIADWAGAIDYSDERLRKRIGWLNNQGGFDNAIKYDKVAAAAAGVSTQKVMQLMKDLEEKKDTVNDPTAYVANALRKAGGGQTWAASDDYQPMEVDSDAKLRKRIGWLNKDGGFGNAIKYDKIAEAAVGVSTADVMKILKELEENQDTVKDPTAYAAAALRKTSKGGKPNARTKSGAPAAKKQAQKQLPWMRGGAIKAAAVKKAIGKKKA